ncbi:MAG: glycoside hydrolase family 3 C-terminal domain-containing protein, partial [Bacteroidetes bacterium]|nr:glycoside hydrolase family 3 C-terminal domain-containing protein [Bacteroidota bacterium]
MEKLFFQLVLASSFLVANLPAHAQSFTPRMTGIYHEGWIDLNKNGRKDIYEDPQQPVDNRIENLLKQMTVEEKTCQMATLYGYLRVLKDSLPTPAWKNAIWKDGIANIDEHLNGFTGWDQPVPNLAIVKEVTEHVRAMNLTQEFFIEDTRLGIPADFTNEGIRGVEAYGATSFPTPLAIGATWDQQLAENIGRITGAEARAMGYTNIYAPVLDVARDQRWGRLEESYGEDPYLVGRLGVALAKGLQKNHQVASTAKHFAMYSANFGAREGMARTDPQMPPREVETLLLPPFESAIREAGILGIMASYNDYDGVPVIASSYWLTRRLRKDFGFKGYVVSDSDALEYLFGKHHTAKDREDAVTQTVNAGLNVRTNFSDPGTMILPLRKAVRNGRIPMATLDDRVRDVLRVKFLTGEFDHPYVSDAAASERTLHDPGHKAIALKASHECIVLLKNDRQVLPLQKNIHSIAVIGPNADDASYNRQHYGPRGVEGVSVLQAIREKIRLWTVDSACGPISVRYAKGCDLVDADWPESEVLPQPPSAQDESMMDSAVEAARASDVVVMVMGGSTLTAGEDKSRTSLDLPGFQLPLIRKVYATGKPVVVVYINSQPVTANWVDKFIPGIIEAWYPGMYGGTAIADVLFGDYNPGGKLTVTIPRSVGQLPMNFPSKPSAQTDEGEHARLKGKLYPFGYGLSYTHFDYSDLQITPGSTSPENDISVRLTIKNSGGREGDEVVQLYTHEEVTDVTTYEKNLAGFQRVHLQAGESRQLSFVIHRSQLAIWNKEMKLTVEPGTFIVMAGASSEDIRLKGPFRIPFPPTVHRPPSHRSSQSAYHHPLAVFAGGPAFFYVAPDGSSANKGSEAEPFATLEDARAAIRRLKSAGNGFLPPGGVTVYLRAGLYQLPDGFDLTPRDSGEADAPVVYSAYPGEKVVLTGGRSIRTDQVRPLDEAAAQRILAKEAVTHIREIDLRALGIRNYGVHQPTGFRRPYVNAAMELFINGQPYQLARYPDKKQLLLDTADIVDNGQASTAGDPAPHPGKIRVDRSRLASWRHAKHIIAAGNFSKAWATDQLRVKKINPATGVVSFQDAHYFGITGGKEWNQYYFFNMLEEISQPGEYYIDEEKGKLYFYPRQALKPTDTILVSVADAALICLKGASHVTFSHIDLEVGRGIGVYMENTVSDRIEDCAIRDFGVVGVCIGKGSQPASAYRLPDPFQRVCPDEKLPDHLGSLHELLYENTTFNREGGKDNGIINCNLENLGCGGVSLGGGDRKTLDPAGNYVYNCQFTNCGRIDYSYKAPVNIDGVGNKIQHCLFTACPATAIYIHGNNHLVEYNEISEACNFVDDQGAVYIGRDPSEFGNTIRYNYFHDIGHFGTTMAVYFDDGACGTDVYGNVFYKAGDRTFMVGGGSFNHIHNNVLIDSKMGFHLDNRLANWQKKNLQPGGLFDLRLRQVNYRLPPYSTAYPGLASYFDHHPEDPQHNDIENNVLVNVGLVNNGKKEWGPVRDNNWVTKEDPGFVDTGARNFALKKNAPLYTRLPDFKEIPFSEMGLIQDTLSTARECRPRQGLPNFFGKLKSGRPVTIAYLGGSITNARGGYREQSLAWLKKYYPGSNISAINAGVGGTASDLANFRLRHQVLAFKPDLVFVEFAVNDQFTPPASIHATMEGIVRQIWRQDRYTDICFLYTMTGD